MEITGSGKIGWMKMFGRPPAQVSLPAEVDSGATLGASPCRVLYLVLISPGSRDIIMNAIPTGQRATAVMLTSSSLFRTTISVNRRFLDVFQGPSPFEISTTRSMCVSSHLLGSISPCYVRPDVAPVSGERNCFFEDAGNAAEKLRTMAQE